MGKNGASSYPVSSTELLLIALPCAQNAAVYFIAGSGCLCKELSGHGTYPAVACGSSPKGESSVGVLAGIKHLNDSVNYRSCSCGLSFVQHGKKVNNCKASCSKLLGAIVWI